MKNRSIISTTILLTFACLALPRGVQALELMPAVGPPTSLAKAKGSGFARRELVALYFDGVRAGSDVTNPNGKLNAPLTVPASARPGNHVVEAVGQTSGVSSRAVFLVRNDFSASIL